MKYSNPMNRFLIVTIFALVGGLLIFISLSSDQVVNAGSAKKIQFTQTVTSMQDPGIGHTSEQLAIVLPPNNGSIYHGSLTYSSSQPLQVVILHQISKDDSKGQPTWSVDGRTLYAETIIDSNSNGGSLDFTGTALGLHSTNSSQFTATVSVDGWIRSTNPESIPKTPTSTSTNYAINLVNSTLPVKIPMHEGMVDGKAVYYIITDSSNNLVANEISEKQNWKVQLSPKLVYIPTTSYGNIYIFTNGLTGNGTQGFQDDVLSFTGSDKQYSPLNKIIKVTWNIGRSPFILNSTQAILNANMSGKVELTVTDTILNTPQIIWNGDTLSVRENKTLSDESSYLGGQVLDIDQSNMVVTFVGHRSWGPDGKTEYYIITSGTLQGPSDAMKIQNVPTLLFLKSSARDLYHFDNGIKGAGPFGYQEGITSAQPGDSTYIPICKVSILSWKDPQNAKILQTIDDINYENSLGTVNMREAMVLNKSYILDCPIIENP